jgi:hypothetical protein
VEDLPLDSIFALADSLDLQPTDLGIGPQLDFQTRDFPTDTTSFSQAERDTIRVIAAQTIPDQSTKAPRPSPFWLGQGGITTGSGTTPTISVQVVTYWLEFSEGGFGLPFYLLGELPTVSDEDPDNYLASLLDEYGGTVNATFGIESRRIAFGSLLSFPSDEQFGLTISARAGLKVLDVNHGEEGADVAMAALGLGVLSARLLLPIWRDGAARTNVNDRAGSLQGELTASFQWSDRRDYRDLFSEEDLLDPGLLFVNANLSLIITNQFAVTSTFTLTTNEDRLDPKASFGLQLLRKVSQ